MQAKIALGLRHFAHQPGHGLQQSVALALERAAKLGVELFKFFFAQALALDQRVQGQTALIVHIQIKPLAPGPAVHFLKQIGAGGLEAVEQLPPFFDVGIGLQAHGQFAPHLLQGIGHRGLDPPTLPGRNPYSY